MARTVIGSSIVIEGELEGDAALVIHGSLKGKIRGPSEIMIEKGAEVEAEIDTEILTIAGRLRGRASAKSRISIGPEGHMTGDLRAPRILIADGAQFKGNVDME